MNRGRRKDKLGFDNRLEEYYSVQKALAMYGFGLKEYEVLKNGYWIRTNRGIKRLLRFDGTEREMRFVYEATEHCSRNGLNEFYRIYPSQSGAPFIKIEGKIYYLTDYTAGSECDFSNPWQLKNAVQLLARFHRAAAGFHLPDELREVRAFWGGWREKFRERNEFLRYVKEQEESKEFKGQCHKRFMRYIDDFISLGEEALEELEKGAYDEAVEREKAQDVFCHGRYSRKYLEAVPERGIVITDFSQCKRDIRLDDLARFIFRVGEWDTDKALFILESYHKEMPLCIDDIKLILVYLRHPGDFYSVAKSFYQYDREHPVRLKEITRTLRKRYAFLEAMERVDYSFLIGPSIRGVDWAPEGDYEIKAISGDEFTVPRFEQLVGASPGQEDSDVYGKMSGDDGMGGYKSYEDYLPDYFGVDPERSIEEYIDALMELEDEDEYMMDDLDMLLERLDWLEEIVGFSDQGDVRGDVTGLEAARSDKGEEAKDQEILSDGDDRHVQSKASVGQGYAGGAAEAEIGDSDAEVEREYGFSVGDLFSDLTEMEKAAEKVAVGQKAGDAERDPSDFAETSNETISGTVIGVVGKTGSGPISGTVGETGSETISGAVSGTSSEKVGGTVGGTIRWKPFPEPLSASKKGRGR